MLEKQLAMVERFHQTVTGLPIPQYPTRLSPERKAKGLEALREEVNEFEDAANAADEADALVDLIYFAYGRLLEMGIRPGPAFQLVHDANMKKVGGTNKRGSLYEAAKPDEWRAPDWDWLFMTEIEGRGQYVGLKRRDTTLIQPKHNPYDGASLPKRKVLLLGYGRHGKDTVAEMLRDHYGLSFTSSSLFCAEKVMMPAFLRARQEWLSTPLGPETGKTSIPMLYDSVEACFNDRHNHRKFWFDEIERFNTPDKASLGKAIFAEHDIYCGLRSKREFAAVKNSGLYDVCIWVDRSDHVPPEDKSSCTVEPWMADYVLDNNGTLEELRFNLDQLMTSLEK